MKKLKYDLSTNEQSVMDLLWATEDGLTSVDIMEQLSDIMKNPSYAHRALNVLLERGFIEECGSVRYNKQYARKFKTSLSREEFGVGLLQERGLTIHSLGRIVEAFMNNADASKKEKKAALTELKQMLDEM